MPCLVKIAREESYKPETTELVYHMETALKSPKGWIMRGINESGRSFLSVGVFLLLIGIYSTIGRVFLPRVCYIYDYIDSDGGGEKAISRKYF